METVIATLQFKNTLYYNISGEKEQNKRIKNILKIIKKIVEALQS